MLPAGHRMRRGDDFARAVKRGRRVGRPTVVMHAIWGSPFTEGRPQSGDEPVDDAAWPDVIPAQVGFVVSRAVGGAVVRTTVKRRLRHVLASRLERIPPSSLVVVRATPAAAGASSAVLGRDVDTLLERLGTTPHRSSSGTTGPADGGSR